MSSRIRDRIVRRADGFSLIEMIVAMFVLALAVVPILGMLQMGAAITINNKKSDDVRAVIQAKMDDVKAAGYQDAKALWGPAAGAPPKETPGTTELNGESFDWVIRAYGAKADWTPVSSENAKIFVYEIRAKDQADAGAQSDFDRNVRMILAENGTVNVQGVREDL